MVKAMNLGVMQPYFFPYLGYFQLIHAVDAFVFYDDVAFRKQGWINRNRILVAGVPRYFSVPVHGASSTVAINETLVDRAQLPRWRRRFLRTLAETYASSRQLRSVLELVAAALEAESPDVGSLAQRSVRLCCEYLGLDTRLLASSRSFPAAGAVGAARILEICRASGASTYVNPPGGRQLYDRATFARHGVALRFLAPRLDPYPQPAREFASGLSILDLLLRQDRAAARRATRQGSLE
jgi:hypothetical protein